MAESIEAAHAQVRSQAAGEVSGGMSRSIQFVRVLEMCTFICWCFTMSIGCYGFYLGFDTKEETSAKDGVCGFNADKQTCVLLADRGKLCRACHESGFDVMMILISFYMAFFGVVGMGTSCGFGTSLQGGRFGFMRNRMGRGFFLFFMGTLAVAQGANFLYTQSLTLGVGIVDCVVGFAMMFSYCFVKSGEAVVRVRNNGQQYQAIAG